MKIGKRKKAYCLKIKLPFRRNFYCTKLTFFAGDREDRKVGRLLPTHVRKFTKDRRKDANGNDPSI